MWNDFLKKQLSGMVTPEMGEQIQGTVNEAMTWMGCLYDLQADQLELWRSQNGKLPEHIHKTRENPRGEMNPDYAPRSLGSPPRFYQAQNFSLQGGTRAGILVETTIKVFDDLGRYPSSGYYANLGETEFDVTIRAADDSFSELHTLPPNVNIPISCFVKEIIIHPVKDDLGVTQIARFQVRVD